LKRELGWLNYGCRSQVGLATVLHVDDNAEQRRVVAMVVDGFRDAALVQAKDALEAEPKLTQILGTEPVLMCCDHIMPGERGAVFLQRRLATIRAAGACMGTSFASRDEVTQIPGAGINGVLDLPLDLDEFEALLDGVMRDGLSQI
jgi:CheY-like chemotaxis protein